MEKKQILKIEGTLKTPTVFFDGENGLFQLTGRSTPENTEEFFRPLFEYTHYYLKAAKAITQIDIYFEYFNSSTAKYIIRFLQFFEILEHSDKQLVVNWGYDDEETLEYGQEFSEVTGIPFNYMPYTTTNNK